MQSLISHVGCFVPIYPEPKIFFTEMDKEIHMTLDAAWPSSKGVNGTLIE